MPTFITAMIEVFDIETEREVTSELVGLAINSGAALISIKTTGDGYGPDEHCQGSKGVKP